MDQEWSPQLEGLAIAHQLAAAKYDGIVNDNEDARLFDCGHGRDTSLEPEVLSRVSNYLLKGLAEDRPQVHAKWPLERRDGELLEERRKGCGRHFVNADRLRGQVQHCAVC